MSPKETLPKVYQATEIEKKWYPEWERRGYFRPEVNPKGEPFTIVIPPPNVTGILHMGHALNSTIQDILTRTRRMQGRRVLWLPGTDHAGIATQNVVERDLAKTGKRRQDLGREAFVQRVWEWKKQHGSTIVKQLRDLGASLDWSRERFTMDEGLTQAVREVFLKLHKEGLIFRGVYLVNWCPRCQTALSDEESEHREVAGHLWHIRYPLKQDKTQGSAPGDLVVATTRPETMLGDTACAVNPKDKHNQHLVGRKAVLPIIGRELPVIADSVVDSEFGTGVVKITPAHDPNDFAFGQNHQLSAINILNPDGTLNENAGPYQGKDRFQARKEIIEELKTQGLLVKVEDHRHSVGHCYRCHTVVEPLLTDQWFVRLAPMAKTALKVGGVKFHPDRWTKIYLNWMKNAKDWCISRQIWWGHRIPAWYCEPCYEKEKARFFSSPLDFTRGMDEKTAGIMVGLEAPSVCPHCKGSQIRQDEDVLDTWFSSWLWPFSTLGWPKKTADLKTFYPTQDLATAPEIIFFWVARMIMGGVHFLGEIPFQNVYIHGTVRDDAGKKMSKSLGNAIDPLHIIEEVGADALRFSLVILSGTGNDVFLNKQKFTIGRNFTNKIWNAARFLLMNIDPEIDQRPATRAQRLEEACTGAQWTLSDRWILSELDRTIDQVTKSLNEYRLNEASQILYDFIWREFCDWYVELAKPRIQTPLVQTILVECLDGFLRLLHPVMPFLTEEIWQKIPHEGDSIMVASWPKSLKGRRDTRSEEEMKSLIATITACRNHRSEWNVPQEVRTRVTLIPSKKGMAEILKENRAIICQMAKIEKLDIIEKDIKLAHVATSVTEFCVAKTHLEGLIDLKKQKQLLERKLDEATRVITSLKKRLTDKKFLDRAPSKVVEKEQERLQELESRQQKFHANLKAIED
jgi:valyl-tRNA synthetase